MTETERLWLRLHLIPGLGRRGIFRLLQVFGSPQAALKAPDHAWKSAGMTPSVLAARNSAANEDHFTTTCNTLASLHVRLVSFWDEVYPSLLRAIPDPPALLYLRGQVRQEEGFAIVGSRGASPAGTRLTQEISRELSSRGICIVSGLARGIDTAAHQGALDGGGATTAVLGCGIDRIYPPENARLFHRILDQDGTILTEYPPGTPPLAGHFPGRNRIISGLCRGVLIVEAAEGSGSLITADFALEQGREVFAVPAAVYSPVGGGVNRLLKEGATLVTESSDILERLWPSLPTAAVRRHEETVGSSLAEPLRSVYAVVSDEPLHIDDLSRKCGLTPPQLSAILLDLELNGSVEQLPGMRYIRNRRFVSA